KPVLPLLKGMAHITGGGLPGNVARLLPEGVTARFASRAWEVPPIFRLIQKRGAIPDKEMRRVFNLGLGMVLFCSPENVARVKEALPEARPVGEVVRQEGEERVELV
ncbi:MAG: AIR synthase-related protein, partial [Chloroflexota bacterium]|nr:AIR synthase-related protein [Chloroflexota bacterium]